MALADTLVSKPPPVHQDDTGTLRVGGTRVALDTIVSRYLDGSTPEEIAIAFSSVRLEDIYAVISYYLANRSQVDVYLADRANEAAKLQEEAERRHPPDGLRALLIERLQKRNAETPGG